MVEEGKKDGKTMEEEEKGVQVLRSNRYMRRWKYMSDHESSSDCKLNFTKELPTGDVLYMDSVNGELHRTLCIIVIANIF